MTRKKTASQWKERVTAFAGKQWRNGVPHIRSPEGTESWSKAGLSMTTDLPAGPGVYRARSGIGIRTALFCWLVSILTIAVFASYMIPSQKKFFLSVLESKALTMSTAIRDTLIGAVATDDYSDVVEYCLNTVSSDDSVLYFVVTRCDGFSLIHTDSSWKMETLGAPWLLESIEEGPHGAMEKTELHPEQVYHYIKPIHYSGVGWGWVHIGLSLEQYHANVEAVYEKAAIVALLCIFIGLGVAIVYARRLVKPIRQLKLAVERVAHGELSVHTDIVSRDEVGSLSHSFNEMTDVLRQTHAELVEAKVEAETASISKSEFLANMSHEIRTPLNGVVGNLKLLTHTPLETKQQLFVKQAVLSSEALLTVINDILDFSKIEAGRMEFENVRFELLLVIENVVQMFAVKAEEKEIELASLVYRNVPASLMGDPSRIGQILINLISNAIKFTDSGEVILRVFVEDETSEDVILRFDVADTGIGISKKEQNRVFEPFRQEDNTTTRRFGGTGLGLGISKQLAELMEGCLSVESTPGKGSTFSFSIHLNKADQTGVPKQRATSMKGLRILIVEDHPVSREIIGYQLDAWGCEYTAVAEGESALETLNKNADDGTPFDLALIDWNMPGMDGAELGRRIKQNELIKDTTLIMLSSANKVSSQYYQEIGFATYLTKPTKQSELYNAIVDALNNVVRTDAPVSMIQNNAKRNAQLKVNILLAEDNEINQDVASEILSMCGFKCDIVQSGLEAVNATQEKSYDLVFMDGMMPDMDGYEATRLIRAREAGSGIRLPIIALTANAMRGDRERCLAAGMDDYLSKPVDPERMVAMVDKWRSHTDETEESVAGDSAIEPPDFAIEPTDSDDKQVAWFDREALEKRCMGNEELINKLLLNFITQTAVDLAAAENFLEAFDPAKLMHSAHRIKGAAANLSMEKLRAAAAGLEEAARNEDATQSMTCYQQLKSTYEKTKLLVGEIEEAASATG